MAVITGRNEVVAEVIFLHLFVILFTGGGGGVSASVHAGIPHPPEQTCPREHTPPQVDTPWSRHAPGSRPPLEQTLPSRHPPMQTPPEQTPPLGADIPQNRNSPPPEADSGIRSMSGRYASYWNAFLFFSVINFN